MNDRPAGWFPDPAGRHDLRYWDGARWTRHVSDDGIQTAEATPWDAAVVNGDTSGEVEEHDNPG